MTRFFPCSPLPLTLLLASLLTSLLTFGAAVPARAEKADSNKPTNIEADQMAYDDIKQINTFSGNVVLTRGSLLLKADKMRFQVILKRAYVS